MFLGLYINIQYDDLCIRFYLIIGCVWWLLVATRQCVAESMPAMGIHSNGQQRTSAREKQMNHQTAHIIFLSATYILFVTSYTTSFIILSVSTRYPPAIHPLNVQRRRDINPSDEAQKSGNSRIPEITALKLVYATTND